MEKKEKAKLVLHHDDPPCQVRLIDGYCDECKLTPDMQSTCFYYYCPVCDVRLVKMKCPACEKTFDKE